MYAVPSSSELDVLGGRGGMNLFCVCLWCSQTFGNTHRQEFSCKCFNRKNFFPPLCSREPGSSALCFAGALFFFLLLLSFTCRWHHAASFRQVVTSFLFSARSSRLLRVSPDRNVCGRFCWSCLLFFFFYQCNNRWRGSAASESESRFLSNPLMPSGWQRIYHL